MLLAIQFGMQPLFTKTYVNRDADKVMLVLMCEVLKLAIAILLSVCSKKGRESIGRFTLSESLRSAAILAGLYAFQNILIQIGYQNVSGLLFNLLNQTKILFTAIMVYLFTGKTQSRAQMFALFMVLVVGIVLTQPKEDLSEEGKRSAVWSGVVPTLGAAFLSGLGAGWSQRVTRKKNKSAYLFSAEISFYSSVHLVASIVLTSGFETLYPRAINLYEHNPNCWIPLFTNAIGGIFVGQVIKYAGGVSKSFSTIIGIILTGIAEYFLYEQAEVTLELACCIPVVGIAMYIYATNPVDVRVVQDDDKKQK